MALLPADVSEGDGSHDDHHDSLHALFNFFEGLPSGRIVESGASGVGSLASGTKQALVAGVVDTAFVDALGVDAATIGGRTVAEIEAAVLSGNLHTSTITGDGSTLTHPTITHNLGTNQVDVLLLLADGTELREGEHYTLAKTTSDVVVTIDRAPSTGGALANLEQVAVFVTRAGDGPVIPNPLGGPAYTLDAAGGGAGPVLPLSPPQWSTAWVQNANGQSDEFYVYRRTFSGSFAWSKTDGPSGALYLNALRPSATLAGAFGAALNVTAGAEPQVIVGTADAGLTITYTAAADGQPVQVFVKHDGTDRTLSIAGAALRQADLVTAVTAGGCVVDFVDLGDGTIVVTTTDLDVI